MGKGAAKGQRVRAQQIGQEQAKGPEPDAKGSQGAPFGLA
jgi:hypothetical protein